MSIGCSASWPKDKVDLTPAQVGRSSPGHSTKILDKPFCATISRFSELKSLKQKAAQDVSIAFPFLGPERYSGFARSVLFGVSNSRLDGTCRQRLHPPACATAHSAAPKINTIRLCLESPPVGKVGGTATATVTLPTTPFSGSYNL